MTPTGKGAVDVERLMLAGVVSSLVLAAPSVVLCQFASRRTVEQVQQDLLRDVAAEDYEGLEREARTRKRRLKEPIREGEIWNPVFFRVAERASPRALAIFLVDPEYRDAENNWGWNWLQYAISRKATSAYRALVRSGIDLGHTDRAGYSALHHAALRGDGDAAKVLIEMNVSPDIRAMTGETPLMVAVTGSRVGLVELLLAAGADVGLRDRNGDSTMHFAARGGNRGLLELLLARGGTLDLPARNGWTPRQELTHWFPGLLLRPRAARP